MLNRRLQKPLFREFFDFLFKIRQNRVGVRHHSELRDLENGSVLVLVYRNDKFGLLHTSEVQLQRQR